MLCSLTVCCSGTVAATEASPDVLNIPAESMMVIQVFAPERMAEIAADSSHPLQQAAQNRLRRFQESYKCSDPMVIHYGVKNAQGERVFLTETTPAETRKKLEIYFREELQRMTANGVAPKNVYLYVRGDFHVPWRRVALLVDAATHAGIEHIIMSRPFHENSDDE